MRKQKVNKLPLTTLTFKCGECLPQWQMPLRQGKENEVYGKEKKKRCQPE